jgi:hypothetical protein
MTSLFQCHGHREAPKRRCQGPKRSEGLQAGEASAALDGQTCPKGKTVSSCSAPRVRNAPPGEGGGLGAGPRTPSWGFGGGSPCGVRSVSGDTSGR